MLHSLRADNGALIGWIRGPIEPLAVKKFMTGTTDEIELIPVAEE
jgi:hypothetical protein